GNDGPWKARKTKNRFPSLSPALGNRKRFPHSHRLTTTTLFPKPNPNTPNLRKDPLLDPRLLLQAHLSIGICSVDPWKGAAMAAHKYGMLGLGMKTTLEIP